MELPELYQLHECASRQVDILERRLSELQQRPLPESEQEFNYLVFQISVVQGVKKMYEEYRNEKWSKLQQESTDMLQEILATEDQSDMSAEYDPLSPPHSPPTTPTRPAMIGVNIFDIPPPLTPIRDPEDMFLTPPTSPRSDSGETDRFHFSRNLSSLFSELPRDL